MLRAVSTIGGFTFLSRIFGFVRDMLVANVLGAGFLGDAFFVAFKLPNFLRRLFAEGAFNAAFVPLFAGTLEDGGQAQARRFAEDIMAVLTLILLAVTVLAELFMPALLHLFAPGFGDTPDKFATAVALSRLTFPYILFISLVTLLSGILNSFSRFAAVAAAPIIMNLVLIAALLGFGSLTQTPAHALAWGVSISGLLQLLWLGWHCNRIGLLPRWRKPQLTGPVKQLLKLAAPAAFGAGIAQVNLLVDVVLASLFPGAVSWLYYADRLNELPIGVIGVAVGTALLPMLSRTIRAGDNAAAIEQMNHALMLAMAVVLPATTALITIPVPLITTMYEHGAFSAADTASVVPAMVAFACGLPAFILIKVFAPGFFARQDTKTPVKIGLLCLFINLFSNLILMQFFAHVGLAMGTTAAGWINALAMGWVLYRRGHFVPQRVLIIALGKALLASAIMGVALVVAQQWLPWGSGWQEIVSLAVLVAGGGAFYTLTALVLGVVPPAQLRAFFRRAKPVT